MPEPVARTALGIDTRRAGTTNLDQARGRVAEAAGRAPDATVADLLNRVLIEAPGPDLWVELAEQVRDAWAARRRSQRLLTVAVIAAIVLMLGAATVWLTGFRPGSRGTSETRASADTREWPSWPPSAEEIPTPTPALASFAAVATTAPEEPALRLPDQQFLRLIEQAGDSQSALALYDPATNTSTDFLPAGGPVMISQDGAWALAERELRATPGRSLLAAGRFDGGATWETEIASPRALAIGPDTVYVLNLANPDALQIQTLALDSGEPGAGWPLGSDDFVPARMRSARLQLSTDGARLYLLSEWKSPDNSAWVRAIVAFDTATGAASTVRATPLDAPEEGTPTDFSVASARPIPAEDAVYSVVQDRRSGQAVLRFLDLPTGAISSQLLGIPARVVPLADQRGENELHLVPSNTGKTLYVIQTRQRQVAIVDLNRRRVSGVFPITPRPEEASLFERNLNHVSYLEALLSPDGTRLYLAVNREKNQALNSYPARSPVWVVNTTTWQVDERWVVSGLPRRMTMSGDGRQIYLRSSRADGQVRLTTFDTASGEPLEVRDTLPAPDWADIQRIGSVEQSYHEQYGFRPGTGPVAPVDNSILAVLPGISVEADDVVAGAETTVTARLVHPLTGAPAVSDRTLRFDRNATLIVELTNGEEQAILVPSSVETGVYAGQVRMDGAGSWDARATIINSDGTSWTAEQADAIEVSEGFVAATGGAYRFVVRPANPVNRRTVTLRVWMVASDERERLPEEIEFLDLISEDVQIVLTHPSGERVVEDLSRIDHDSFLGWARFGAAGEWTATIVLGLGNGERITVNAGSFQISDLTEPFEGASATTGGSRMGNPASQ